MLSLLLLFALLYFLMIRPQMKRQKEHRAMLAALSINDEIATTGGIMGRITALRDSHVEIEVTHGVIICIQRPSIAQVLPKGTLPKTTK
jgi:preprotein translocase subunit YajC